MKSNRSLIGMSGLVACILLGLAAPVSAQIFNMTFKANVSGGLRSVWGYTDTLTGKEYALACAGSNLKIVEVTNPSAPAIRANVPTVGSDLKEVKVADHYAYVVNQSGALQIVELAWLPDSAKTVATFSSPTVPGQHAIWLRGNNIFLGMNGAGLRDYRILDITNRTAPIELSGTPHPQAACLFADAHDSYVNGNTAYVACLSAGIMVLDVSNPSAPSILGTKGYNGCFTHSMRTSHTGQYLFTTDEVADGHLRVFDVTNPANLVEVASYPIPNAIIHNVFLKDTAWLFTSYYTDGVRVFDVSNPLKPTMVGQYDTYAQGSGASFNGCWDVYPYFPSGTIVASDITNGLFVLTFDDTRAGYYQGTVTDATSGDPIANATVKWIDVVSGANNTTTTDANGQYSLGIPACPIDIMVSRSGYNTSSVNQTPTAEITTTYDFVLTRSGGGVLVGTVSNVDPAMGQPHLLLGPDNAGGEIAGTSTGPTSSQYKFANIPAGNYTIYAGQWGRLNVKLNSAVPSFFTTTVPVSLAEGYEDDFEVARGWTIGAPGDSATSGIWERVDPNGTVNGANPVQPENDAGTGNDRICFITQQGPINAAIGATDVDGGRTSLVTPMMDFSTYGDPQISYDRWYTNSQGSNPNVDVWVVQISNNGGASWVTLENTSVSSASWLGKTFRVLDYLPLTNQMKVKFVASDDCLGSVIEAGVDNFAVVDLAPPSCCIGATGNVDNAGVVDIGDLTALIDYLFITFTPPSCLDEANVNAAGTVDIADLTYLIDHLFISFAVLPSCP